MPAKAVEFWAKYVALGSDNKPLTEDPANHAIYWTADTTRAAAVNAPISLGNGLYNVLLTAAETNCESGGLDGTSTTAGAVIVPVAYTFSDLEALILQIQSKTNTIGASTFTVVRSIVAGGLLTIQQGDDYPAEAPVTMTTTDYAGPTLVTGDVASLTLEMAALKVTFTGTVTVTGSTVTCTFVLTNMQTAALIDGSGYRYQLWATNSTGKITTPKDGPLSVIAMIRE